MADIKYIMVWNVGFKTVGINSGESDTKLALTPIFRAYSMIKDLTNKHMDPL